MSKDSHFKPAWWMTNRHLQTILPRVYSVKLSFTAFHQDLTLSDGDFVELTWTQKPKTITSNTPIVVVLHGLEGSFESFYAARMLEAIHQQGWVGVLMHFRNCGKKANTMAKSYHSGQTQDFAELLSHIDKQFLFSKLYAVGFSLGGNVLAKYVGEQPDNLLSAAVVISAPFDLAECAKTMESGFAQVYQKYLIDKMKRSTLKKLAIISKKATPLLDVEQLHDIKTITEFDDKVTAPLNGFKNAEDYYKQSSAKQFLSSIKTPTLIIHAEDDPFMNSKATPQLSDISDCVTLEVSKQGGHVGFISGNNPFQPIFWAEQRTTKFLSGQ